jgi:hypothetical protein
VLETELERLGVTHKHSRPYHPQTCGKVERFHQTLKLYLAKQGLVGSLTELQSQIDRFVAYYNECRPHRSLGRRTPREVFDEMVKAHPPPGKAQSQFRIRHDRIDKTGRVTLRYDSRLRHIGVGRAHAGRRIELLVADRDVRVIDADTGELIRALRIDPAKDYQPLDST